METTNCSIRLLNALNDEGKNIVRKYGIETPSLGKVTFVDKLSNIEYYISNVIPNGGIICKIDYYKWRGKGDKILVAELYYTYSGQIAYLEEIHIYESRKRKSDKELLEIFDNSLSALKYMELPISLEYKIREDPFVDWSDEIVKYIDKII